MYRVLVRRCRGNRGTAFWVRKLDDFLCGSQDFRFTKNCLPTGIEESPRILLLELVV